MVRTLAGGRVFTADPASAKPAYSIVIPPPNVTGVLTMGHVLNNTIQDILARRARCGKRGLWLPGSDHAGIATQTVVERKFRKEEGKTRHDLGREAFIQKVWEWKEKYGGIIIQQLQTARLFLRLVARTVHDGRWNTRARCRRTFVDLYRKGLIYRGTPMVTGIRSLLDRAFRRGGDPDAAETALYYVRYEVVDEPGTFIEVATTRPETIMGDTAMAVNPDDPRYAAHRWQKVWRPFSARRSRSSATRRIDPEFGTGVLKVTPAHDKVDFEIGQRHGLPVIDVAASGRHAQCAGRSGTRRAGPIRGAQEGGRAARGARAPGEEEPYQNTSVTASAPTCRSSRA